MADEATITSGLAINVGSLSYQSFPSSFTADVSSSGGYGPTPGYVSATINGAAIDLSKLSILGGLCRIQNLDLTNFITIGMYDPDTTRFYGFMDLLPGESFVFRLSRNYQTEYGVAGTGTEGINVAYYVKVDPSQVAGTTCPVLVEAFNR